jgi:hypothetical protein
VLEKYQSISACEATAFADLTEEEMMKKAILTLAASSFVLYATTSKAQSVWCTKDQTSTAVKVDFLTKKISDSAKGACLFLLPAPEKGADKHSKVPVDGLTYWDCAKQGDEAIAFKWIPPSVMSYKEISDAILVLVCSGPCPLISPPTCPGVCFCTNPAPLHCE